MTTTYPHFTIAYWCVLVAAFLPVVCAGISKWGSLGKSRRDGGFDNNNPRAWMARQTDWRARANAAQANTFEALPFFFAAVIIAHQLQASQARVDILALLFIFLRLGYILMYVADMATPRSVIWALALLVNILILFAGFH
ncbi:MAG: MAPEG family protein [Polaromonas sp.]|nr:MAPEG family protein [Polaromonas sp.]